MTSCRHCGVRIEQHPLTRQWRHIEPGDPPYRHCRYATAEPETSFERFLKIVGRH